MRIKALVRKILLRSHAIGIYRRLSNSRFVRPVWRRHNLKAIRAEGHRKRWERELGTELAYWDSELSMLASAGRRSGRKLAARLNSDRPPPPYLADLIVQDHKTAIRILDVGSGPITSLGANLPGYSIEIVAADPLADAYNELLAKYALKPAVLPVRAQAEQLSTEFGANSFDIVHSANAIDHCHDAVQAIHEMIVCAKPAGKVILEHTENEAERQDYSELHQWNFTIKDEHFIAWTDDLSVDVTERFKEMASCRAWRQNGRVYSLLQKKADTG